jgi:hypothetical protein
MVSIGATKVTIQSALGGDLVIPRGLTKVGAIRCYFDDTDGPLKSFVQLVRLASRCR